MRITICTTLLFTVSLLACNSSDKEEQSKKKFISVLSLIESQVKHVDTSLYSIMKVVYTDTFQADTTYIPREEFRKIANDFLTIPDLWNPKVAKKYREEPARYDDMMGRVILTYVPIDPDKEEIKKQELLITPSPVLGDKVSNIMINREISNRDSFIRKDMLWLMDRSFQVTTTSQKVGKPEIITVTRVIWNEDNE
jgi:hypothetical protein